MEYCKAFPNYVGRRGKRFLYHHRLFMEYRKWLETNVGVQKEDWDYIPGDIHADGICFKRKEDLTAFTLRFNVDP